MIAWRSIFFLIGILLSIMGAAMLIPLLLEAVIYKTDMWQSFAASAFVTGFVGSALTLANRPHGPIKLGVREAFLLTTLSWTMASLFSGLPIYWSVEGISLLNAAFESVSALTTTGATILTNLESMPKGVLLWRAILQWLGGTGIILMAMTVLPILSIGGMQLFRSEFSDRSEKILPRVSQIASAILTIYISLTAICGVLYYLFGMSVFDALCHSLTTFSTGGLANYDDSIAAFDSTAIEVTAMVFMTLGACTLILWIKLWHGDWESVYKDPQLRAFLKILLLMAVFLSLWQWSTNDIAFSQSLREGCFAVISIISTCGYTTSDYTQWGTLPVMLILILSSVGGCTGSTTGSIKIFRLQILFTMAATHLRILRRSHGVYVPLYNNQKVSESVAMSVFTFIILYFMCHFTVSVLLAITGVDAFTAISAATATLTNVGPGAAKTIGPSGNYTGFTDAAKGVLMFAMIVGRLELLTVFAIFMPSFWRS